MTVDNQLLLLQLAFREAQRRSKKRKPAAHWLIEVLTDLGFKLQASK